MMLHVGYGNYVPTRDIIGIVRSDTYLRQATGDGRVLSMRGGQELRAYIIMGNGDIILSAHTPQCLARRMEKG